MPPQPINYSRPQSRCPRSPSPGSKRCRSASISWWACTPLRRPFWQLEAVTCLRPCHRPGGACHPRQRRRCRCRPGPPAGVPATPSGSSQVSSVDLGYDSSPASAHRRCAGTDPARGLRAASPQAQDAPMCTVAMRTQPACGAPSPERNAPVPQVCRGRPAWLLRLRVQPTAAELGGRSGGARAPRRRRHLAARDAVRQWRCYCLLVWRAQLVWRPLLWRPLFVWLVAHARAAEEQLAPLHVRPL